MIIRREISPSRSLVPPIDINQPALLRGTPFNWLSLLLQADWGFVSAPADHRVEQRDDPVVG